MSLFLEQLLNGLQFGTTLFLMAAGLTLVFGIMGVINLAHGSLYMLGAFLAAAALQVTGSFLFAVLGAVTGAALFGMVAEATVIRRLYARNHLDQVLATFGMILLLNGVMVVVAGRTPLFLSVPAALSGQVEILPGTPYPAYRLAMIAVGLAVALGLWLLITRTRLGMLIRAGATHRETVSALGVDIRKLYTLIFGLGAGLAGLAGVMVGPLLAVEVGMGEKILILTFVVIVIGGVGSVRGALAGALLVGLVDTLGRIYLPVLLRMTLPPADAQGLGAGLASMSIYILMALVLVFRPRGLFPGHG